MLIWTNEAERSSMGFVVVPQPAADAISAYELARRLELGKRRGFGSVKVTVRVGGSEWQTSVFPQKSGTWFLPIKVAVRRAEGLDEGAPVEVELELQ
ncbi:DUF1905 domain-containing protein [Altererythrobacter soli]|uniref:DUF1905 domain-containing protein n=1 Tax=Croceibacterium soli TaxID=1739690 RepID=A0A6I4UWZ0_9SPHN|nr:DUF1905 domain-containing protein [Croceibacterium soli]